MSYLFAFTAMFVGAGVILHVRAEHRRKERAQRHLENLLAARQTLRASDFDAGCPDPVPAEIIDRVRRVLAEMLTEMANGWSVEPERLHPEDDLIDDFAFDLDSLTFFDFVCRLEAEFGFPFSSHEWPPDQPTVGFVVREVAAKLAAGDSDICR